VVISIVIHPHWLWLADSGYIVRISTCKINHITIQFEKLKASLLANPKVKAEYDALAPEFEIAAELLRARLHAGLSQAELAARMGTSQSTIARLENGHTLPSTKTLLRYAEATGSKFQVRPSAAWRVDEVAPDFASLHPGCGALPSQNGLARKIESVEPDQGDWRSKIRRSPTYGGRRPVEATPPARPF
jgi:transcriptional regulator with XRE-family HTH domain